PQFLIAVRARIADPGSGRTVIVDADVARLEDERSAGIDSRPDEILDDLVLRVHCDGAATGKVRERDAMRLAAEAERDAGVGESFPLQAHAAAAASNEIDGALRQPHG